MKHLQICLAIILFLPITAQANTETLTSGESINSHVAEGIEKQYKITALSGQTITGVLDQLSADADLRMKIGSEASLHSFDCKSINGGQQTDSCSLVIDNDIDVYVSVHGYRAADYRLTVTANANKPLITSPNVGNILSAPVQVFNVDNNGLNIDYWWLRVGSTLGGSDVSAGGGNGALSAITVRNLPTDGSPIFVRLRYKENGTWKTASDYHYTSSKLPLITSPVTGSSLSG